MGVRLGVLGVNGKLGRAVAAAALATPDVVLAGGSVRPGQALAPGIPTDIERFDDVTVLARRSDVLIDVSAAGSVAVHAGAAVSAGIPLAVGVTGFDRTAEAALDRAAERVAVLLAPNFAPGVAVLLALASRLGAFLDGVDWDAEIVETHHRHKRDAPSGTALALGRAVAAGRGVPLEAVAERNRAGSSIGRAPGAIGFASLRAGSVVGEHTLTLTAAGEQITLAHRAFDRGVFATGAVRAALWLHGKAPGHYRMADVLDLRS